jgi:hypothetical protein
MLNAMEKVKAVSVITAPLNKMKETVDAKILAENNPIAEDWK